MWSGIDKELCWTQVKQTVQNQSIKIMAKQTSVGVIIPVFNRTGYLGETIRSVLAQSYDGWQLMVVDDGSSEDVSAVLAQFDDERIRLARQENQGNAAARNTGIEQTASEYVICLDSDDVWHGEMLADSVRILELEPTVDVVYTQRQLIDAKGVLMPGPPAPGPYEGEILDALLMGYPILPSSALVRRSCFERWGMFTPGLDDWDLWLRWAAQGCSFRHLERPLLNYRIHDQNFNLDWDKRCETHMAILDRFYASGFVTREAKLKENRVYANQHLYFCEMAWRAGRNEDGVSEFTKAVERIPDYLGNIEFYYRLACAHQSRLEAGTRDNLDLDAAELTINECLDSLFRRSSLKVEIRRQRDSAYAYAYLSLGRLAYSAAHDMARARGFLRKSAEIWPAIAIRSDWIFWQTRSLIGFRRLGKVKRALAAPDGGNSLPD